MLYEKSRANDSLKVLLSQLRSKQVAESQGSIPEDLPKIPWKATRNKAPVDASIDTSTNATSS